MERLHKFTLQDISQIRIDFKEFIKDLEGTEQDLQHVLAFMNGYILGLEKVYGAPIEKIEFIDSLENIIMEYYKFFKDNPNLYELPFIDEFAKTTLDKVRKIIVEGIIVHRFTKEEISNIKEDFRKIIKDLEESLHLIYAVKVIVVYTKGYIAGQEKAYGTPIEEIEFITDLRDLAEEQIKLYDEDREVYLLKMDDIAEDLWNRIKRTLL